MPNLNTVEDPPLAVQGQAPASGLFSFDKYSSAVELIEAARDASAQPDAQRRLFVAPNAHVTRLNTAGGTVFSVEVFVNGVRQLLPIKPTCAVILAAGTVDLPGWRWSRSRPALAIRRTNSWAGT